MVRILTTRLIAVVIVALLTLASVGVVLAQGSVSISAGGFLRDDRPWIAEGVTLVGFVAPQEKLRPAYAKARQKFGPDLMRSILDYGADLIRFQISQAGLDPQSEIFDPDYRQEVLDAIRLARSYSFTVIISMQWQPPSGLAGQPKMPSEITRRAWESILPAVAKDTGIMLELFNEPGLKKRTPENWAIWQSTMQELIDLVRSKGSENVLLVGGLRGAKYLVGAPHLFDPLKQTGYAVHPFLIRFNRTERQWERNWGAFARTHPVMATAFNARSERTPAQCSPSMPDEATNLLSYLRKLRIGLVIWAFDLPGVRRGNRLTNFDNFMCDGGNNGAGQLVHDYFLAH